MAESVDSPTAYSSEIGPNSARLRALEAQIQAERKIVRNLKESLDRVEAQSTRARREELQLRLLVVHLATLVANAAANSPDTPALAAAQAVLNDGSVAQLTSIASAPTLPALTCSAEAVDEVDRFAEHLEGLAVSVA